MALERKSNPAEGSSGVSEYTNLEVGDHDGRLVFVADLGLQRKEYKGEYKGDFQQLSLGIEVVGETVTIDDKEVPHLMWTRPFYIYDTLTEKGLELKLFKVFDSSAKEGEVPDWEAQLGKPCNIVNKHVEKDGVTYDNIDEVTSIPAKYQDAVPQAKLETGIGMDSNIKEHLFGLAKYVFDKQIEVDKDNAEPDRDF